MILWPSLTDRHLEPEWMDDPALDHQRHQHALEGIARMNRASGSANFLWKTIKSLVDSPGQASKPNASATSTGLDRSLRVLDLSCGAGDNVLAMAELAKREGVEAEFQGGDLSPTAIEHARAAALNRDLPVTFFRLDVLREPIPRGFDVLTNTLFLHHLDRTQASEFLRAASQAAPRLVLSDLIRSRRGLLIAGLATRLLTRSPVVHIDGPQSVRAAFTPAELAEIADQAGVPDCKIQRHFPERMCLTWAGENHAGRGERK